MKNYINIQLGEPDEDLISRAQIIVSSKNLDPSKGIGMKISGIGTREIIDLGDGCYLLIDDETGDWVVGCFVEA
ncbi:MAG: hypothetical protein AAFY73_04660 [Pseudomonadota bacterium]